MLPKFPEFKKLEFSDKDDVDEITSKYEPYSDFNFVSMWSWDIAEEMRISRLNDNFVVRFTDYVTGEPFYSFLGNNKVNDTVAELMKFSTKEGLDPILKLIPEISAADINKSKYKVEEDRGNFDYILSMERLKPHDGSERKLSSRRVAIKKFLENNDVKTVEIDLMDAAIQRKITEVFLLWEHQVHQEPNDLKHLSSAFERFFLMKDFKGIKAFGVFIAGELAGYTIDGLCPNGFALGHFQQGNVKVFSGIYALLMQETAPYFLDAGCKYINLEQDLNIPGLRNWKSSYKSETFLKKYIVTPVEKGTLTKV